jgi:hypothetical protein
MKGPLSGPPVLNLSSLMAISSRDLLSGVLFKMVEHDFAGQSLLA